MNKIIMYYKQRKQEKEVLKQKLVNLKKESEEAYSDFKKLFEDKRIYVELNLILSWQEKYNKLQDEISVTLNKQDFKFLIKIFNDTLIMVPRMYKYINKFRIKHNRRVLEILKSNGETGIFTIEDKPLDKYQTNAMLKSDKVSLIIGPGTSGLTYTCAAKAKYLLKKNICKENELLIISDTKRHADNLNRILSNEKLNTRAKTFEDLCKEILFDYKREYNEIISTDMDIFVKEKLANLLNDDSYKKRFCDYYLFHRQAGASIFDFKKVEDYDRFIEDYPSVTIKGDRVLNYEHLAVANFLLRNNIDYKYMQEYCVSVLDYEGKRYRPTFYLPDFDIYIEVFEINSIGEAASRKVTSLISKTSTEIYRESINIIRSIHEKNETVHIEVFTYEKMNGTLFEHLQAKLLKARAVMAPMHIDELWEIIIKQTPYLISEVSVIISELMHLSRDNSHTWEDIVNLNREKSRTLSVSYRKNESIVSLLIPVFEEYISHIGNNNDIYSITEMTTNVIKIMKKELKYKCIIVDNFENMNGTRAQLLKVIFDNIRQKNKSILFCAGNDWQCLSGKNAADFSYITEFSRFFEMPETTYLMNVYLQGQKLYLRNARFIERNNEQIKKYAKCKLQSEVDFVVSVEYSYRNEESINIDVNALFDEEEVKIVQNTLKKYLKSLPDEYSVVLVGRFMEDIELCVNIINDKVKYRTVYDLDESADVIIIVNARKHILGFPHRIAGDHVKDLFSLKPDFYPHAAERRLWHTAISRAKHKVAFLYNTENRSRFTDEYLF